MLKRLVLCHKINKFYHIFWEVLGYSYEYKVHSLDYNTLHNALFDINEALEAYDDDQTDGMYRWLDKLASQVMDRRDKEPLNLNTILFNICNTKNGLRPHTEPIYKFAQWLYKKGII